MGSHRETARGRAALGSLILFSSRIGAVRDFYNAIGVVLEPEVHDEGPTHYAAEMNGIHLALYQAPDGSAPGFREGGCTWPGFRVSDLDATLERLVPLATKVLLGPEERPWGVRVVVEDPDGRPVELWSAKVAPKRGRTSLESSPERTAPSTPRVDAMVRAAELRDAEAWAQMRARLWPDANASELAAETRAFFAGSAPPYIAAAFVAEARGSLASQATLVGFLEVAIRPFSDGCDSMPVPHVEGWYVEPSARGQDVGRELMKAAEAWARGRDFLELASDTEIENHASLLAHQACGFEEVDQLRKFRKILVLEGPAGAVDGVG
jgi:aminoglycoside 6'-N-acetyltransferase I